MKRRQFLATGSLALAGCRPASREIEGGFTGIGLERGHRLRPASSAAPGPATVPRSGLAEDPPAVTRRVHTLIAGGGVAGLAAARALRQRGIDDFVVLELEDSAGGNSRGGTVGGIACPLGAHYLPRARRRGARGAGPAGRTRPAPASWPGRWVYDERHLCHSPQERLFFNGEWHDGLLPVQGVGAATLAQYRRFARLVGAAHAVAPFAMPAFRAPASSAHLALDALTFAGMAGPRGPERPAPALVPGLLLPRRLRRRAVHRLGLGRHPLLRQPPRLPRPGRRRRRARRRADLARRQRLAHAQTGRAARRAVRRAAAHRPRSVAHRGRPPRRHGRCAGRRHPDRRALAGRELHRRAAAVRGRARGGEPAGLPAPGGGTHPATRPGWSPTCTSARRCTTAPARRRAGTT